MKAIDVPAKKVEGWILPEMPGKGGTHYIIMAIAKGVIIIL